MNTWIKRLLIALGLIIGLIILLVISFLSNINKQSKFFQAIHNNDLITVEKLIEQGIDVNIQNPKSGSTALFTAIQEKNIPLIKLLLHHDADLTYLGEPLINEVPRDSEIYNLLKEATNKHY